MPSSRHRPLAVASLLAAAFLPAAWAQDNAHTFPPGFIVAMDVVVDPDGRIARVEPDADVAAPVRQALLRRVPEWRYEAPTWLGRPAEVTTRLALRLQFAPVQGGGGYALRVQGLAFDPAIRTMVPQYPRRALRRGIGGTFVYRVSLGTGGVATRAERVPAPPPDDPSAGLDEVARQTFESWRWPVPRVDGQPVACELLVPIVFQPRSEEGEAPPTEVPGPPADLERPCPAPVLKTPVAGVLL